MRTESVLHHPLADVRIHPIERGQAREIKKLIMEALDDYLEETSVAAAVLHAETKARHGDMYKTPGYYLRIYRMRADLSQNALAHKLEVRQHHLSEMEHNKRPIGKALAKKLAVILNCDYHKFL